jgi:hypothetical protein
VATVNVTETPTTLDTTGAAELAVTNTGSASVYVNTQRLRPGQRGTFDTSRPLMVVTQVGQTSTVDTNVAAPIRVAVGTGAVAPSGDTTGATDRAAINAALTAAAPAGTVQLNPGATYVINGPLIIPLAAAGLTFDLGGATIQLAPGSNSQLLWDAAHAGGNLTVPSPMGSYTVQNGVFDKGANTGGGNGLHSVILGGNGVTVRNLWMRSTAGKYAILLQNIVGGTVENIRFNTFSDGVHVQGPASHLRVRNLQGTTGDDMFAITACDYSTYVWGNEGDVSDVQVDGISLTAGNARAAIVVTGKNGTTPLNVTDVRVANIAATQAATNTSPLVIIGEDPAQAGTRGGNLKRITVDGVTGVLNTPTQSLVSINYASDSTLVFDDITVRNVKWATDAQNAVFVSAKIGSLTVEGVRGGPLTLAPNTVVGINNSASYASIGRLTIRGVDVANPVRGGSLTRASVAGATITEMFCSDIRLDNFAWLLDIITATTVRLVGAALTNMGGLLNVRTPAAVVIAGWAGVTTSSQTSTITVTGTVESRAAEFPLDINNAQVVKANGNRCTARLAAGTIAAGSVAEYNTVGAHWYSTNGTLL